MLTARIIHWKAGMFIAILNNSFPPVSTLKKDLFYLFIIRITSEEEEKV